MLRFAHSAVCHQYYAILSCYTFDPEARPSAKMLAENIEMVMRKILKIEDGEMEMEEIRGVFFED